MTAWRDICRHFHFVYSGFVHLLTPSYFVHWLTLRYPVYLLTLIDCTRRPCRGHVLRGSAPGCPTHLRLGPSHGVPSATNGKIWLISICAKLYLMSQPKTWTKFSPKLFFIVSYTIVINCIIVLCTRLSEKAQILQLFYRHRKMSQTGNSHFVKIEGNYSPLLHLVSSAMQ